MSSKVHCFVPIIFGPLSVFAQIKLWLFDATTYVRGSANATPFSHPSLSDTTYCTFRTETRCVNGLLDPQYRQECHYRIHIYSQAVHCLCNSKTNQTMPDNRI